jgi:GH24 family phage-related lysozyme (muramidase)
MVSTRKYRPPIRKPSPWAYHAGATVRSTADKAGRRIVRQADRAAQDHIGHAINTAVEAGAHLVIVLSGSGIVLLILLFHLISEVKDSGNTLTQFTLKILGLPTSIFGLGANALAAGSSGDMNNKGAPVDGGQVFNRFDGGTVAVSSGWGPRAKPTAGASSFHKGIDLPLEVGYPLFAWTETEVVCSSSSGYGENGLGTLKLANGQVYQAGHLSSCTSGSYAPGQVWGRVGNKGVSTGAHLHWIEKNGLGQIIHPSTNPLQAVVTGKWPGGGGGSSANGIDVDFIKGLEGFHPTAYVDGSEGGRTRWSWGYGTKAPGPGQTISQEQAHADLTAYIAGHCLPIIPENLTPNQKTAAASLCYNAGPAVKNWPIWNQIESGGNPNFTAFTKNTAGANLLPRRQKEQDMWEGK